MAVMSSMVIRSCESADLPAALSVINAAARSYRAFLPPEHYHEPLMTPGDFRREAGRMRFFLAVDSDGAVVGVMGLERVSDVALIRHGYVRPDRQRQGVGEALLAHLEGLVPAGTRIYIGTYRENRVARGHLAKHGYREVADSDSILRAYYEIPEAQRWGSIALDKVKGIP